jgi:hypothetical protein
MILSNIFLLNTTNEKTLVFDCTKTKVVVYDQQKRDSLSTVSLVGEAGLDLRFRPGMDENYGVPAVEPAGSNGPPDRCI